jgi:hypothetical protein
VYISDKKTLKKNSIISKIIHCGAETTPILLSKILKSLPWKRFREDICNLLFCTNILYLDFLLRNLFPYKVKLDRNVFHLGMHHWILRDTYSASIITKYQYRLVIFHLYVLQSFLHPKKLCTTCCCYNILCFYCGQ